MKRKQLRKYIEQKPTVALVGTPIDLRVLIQLFGADTKVSALIQALGATS